MPGLSLEIVEGPGAGRRIELEGPIEIGRDPQADLQLDDELVSRRHVRIGPADDGAVVEDLGSLNGTFVNGAEIKTRIRIGPGDEVLAGVTVFELRSAEQVVARPTAIRPVPPPLATPPRPPDYIPSELVGKAPPEHELDPLLDIHTKAQARLAPLTLLVLVVFAVLIFLATR